MTDLTLPSCVLRVVSAEELLAMPAPDPCDPACWGGWWLDRAGRQIVLGELRADGCGQYEISVDDLATAAGAWRWVQQITEKTWATPAIVVGLIRLAIEVQQRIPDCGPKRPGGDCARSPSPGSGSNHER